MKKGRSKNSPSNNRKRNSPKRRETVDPTEMEALLSNSCSSRESFHPLSEQGSVKRHEDILGKRRETIDPTEMEALLSASCSSHESFPIFLEEESMLRNGDVSGRRRETVDPTEMEALLSTSCSSRESFHPLSEESSVKRHEDILGKRRETIDPTEMEALLSASCSSHELFQHSSMKKSVLLKGDISGRRRETVDPNEMEALLSASCSGDESFRPMSEEGSLISKGDILGLIPEVSVRKGVIDMDSVRTNDNIELADVSSNVDKSVHRQSMVENNAILQNHVFVDSAKQSDYTTNRRATADPADIAALLSCLEKEPEPEAVRHVMSPIRRDSSESPPSFASGPFQQSHESMDSFSDISYGIDSSSPSSRRMTVDSTEMAELMRDLEMQEIALEQKRRNQDNRFMQVPIESVTDSFVSCAASVDTQVLVSNVDQILRDMSAENDDGNMHIDDVDANHSSLQQDVPRSPPVTLAQLIYGPHLNAVKNVILSTEVNKPSIEAVNIPGHSTADVVRVPFQSSAMAEVPPTPSNAVKHTVEKGGTGLRSCLSSRKVPNSMRRNGDPSSSAVKTVVFGSPQVAEFNHRSPTTNFTPMSKMQAKDLFPMAMKDLSIEEDEVTAENSRILEEWDRLTNDSGEFSDEDYFPINMSMSPSTETNANVEGRSHSRSLKRRKSGTSKRRSKRKSQSEGTTVQTDCGEGTVVNSSRQLSSAQKSRRRSFSASSKALIVDNSANESSDLASNIVGAACDIVTANANQQNQSNLGVSVSMESMVSGSCEVSGTVQLGDSLAYLVSSVTDKGSEAMDAYNTYRNVSEQQHPVADVSDHTQELETNLHTLLHRMDMEVEQSSSDSSSSGHMPVISEHSAFGIAWQHSSEHNSVGLELSSDSAPSLCALLTMNPPATMEDSTGSSNFDLNGEYVLKGEGIAYSCDSKPIIGREHLVSEYSFRRDAVSADESSLQTGTMQLEGALSELVMLQSETIPQIRATNGLKAAVLDLSASIASATEELEADLSNLVRRIHPDLSSVPLNSEVSADESGLSDSARGLYDWNSNHVISPSIASSNPQVSNITENGKRKRVEVEDDSKLSLEMSKESSRDRDVKDRVVPRKVLTELPTVDDLNTSYESVSLSAYLNELRNDASDDDNDNDKENHMNYHKSGATIHMDDDLDQKSSKGKGLQDKSQSLSLLLNSNDDVSGKYSIISEIESKSNQSLKPVTPALLRRLRSLNAVAEQTSQYYVEANVGSALESVKVAQRIENNILGRVGNELSIEHVSEDTTQSFDDDDVSGGEDEVLEEDSEAQDLKMKLKQYMFELEQAREEQRLKQTELNHLADIENELFIKQKNEIMELNKIDILKEKSVQLVEREKQILREVELQLEECDYVLGITNGMSWCRVKSYKVSCITIELTLSEMFSIDIMFHLGRKFADDLPSKLNSKGQAIVLTVDKVQVGSLFQPRHSYIEGQIVAKEKDLVESYLSDVLLAEDIKGPLSTSELLQIKYPKDVTDYLLRVSILIFIIHFILIFVY